MSKTIQKLHRTPEQIENARRMRIAFIEERDTRHIGLRAGTIAPREYVPMSGKRTGADLLHEKDCAEDRRIFDEALALRQATQSL